MKIDKYFHLYGKGKELLFEEVPSAESQIEKAFRLFVEWAVECDFGYDNIPEEYEKYKDDIKGLDYAEGLIYIAMREVDNG